AVMTIGQANPGEYSYTFIPAVDARGTKIECSINRDIAYVDEVELVTSAAVPGGCRLGWSNSQYDMYSMVPVGLRMLDPATGHYDDITFMMMLADTSSAPIFQSAMIHSTGTNLPQTGGNVPVSIGTEVQ
ncbi:hypothetical protein PLESTF_001979800, partial [Pleodorina starrii]